MSDYQGWTNYETWAVNLWLANEYGTYRETTERATEVYTEAPDDPDVYEFANWLKDYTDGLVYTDEPSAASAPTTGLASDLFRSAWEEVNWREIAESLLRDAKEEAQA